MKKLAISCLLTILFLISGSTISKAQSRLQTTKSMALGGGGVAYVSDYNALFVNPANIYFRRKNTSVTIGLIGNVNLQAGGPLLNVSAYNKYLTTGARYSVSDFNTQVVPAFFKKNENKSIGVQVDIVPFGFSYGNQSWAIAGAIRTRVISDSYLNKGAMQLISGMNSESFPTPTDVNFGQSALAMGSASLGFSMPVFGFENGLGSHRIIAGIAPKMLFGVNYSSFKMNSTIEVSSGNYIKHAIDYEIQASGGINSGLDRFITDKGQLQLQFKDLFNENSTYFDNATNDAAALNGSGYGLDLGLSYEFLPSFNKDLRILASISLTDLGSINFAKNAGIYGANGTFIFDGTDYDQKRIDEEFGGDFNKYFKYVISDSLAENSYGNLKKRSSSYKKNLPTMLNIGFKADWKALTLVTDFGKGYDDFGMNSRNLIWSSGLEYRLFSFFPLRTGIRMGGGSSNVYSFGTGLEFTNYEFSFSAAITNTSNSGYLLGGALSAITIRF